MVATMAGGVRLSWILVAALCWFGWTSGGLALQVITPAAGDQVIADR